jgi:DNA-binding transcriptional regulator LsrR (DeoR family)
MPDRDERLRWLCSLLHYSVAPLERAEIGGLLSIFDRRNVARYIRESTDMGWVRFSLWPPREPGLSDALSNALGLQATVVSGPVHRRLRDDVAAAEHAYRLGLKRVLGGAAAHVFVERLADVASSASEGDRSSGAPRVGVSGGETLYHLVEALYASRDLPETPFEVIPVSRSLPPDRNSLRLSGGELASLLVDRVEGATAPDLPFLRFVPEKTDVDPDAREVTQDLERKLQARYAQLDVVLTGIGGTHGRTLTRFGRALGGRPTPPNLVGQIFGLPLDREVADGSPATLWETGIGYAALDALRARAERAPGEGRAGPHIVAVAGGREKVPAILSAAGLRRSGASFEHAAEPLVTELVTDRDTAEVLLEALDVSCDVRPPGREALRRWVAGYLSLIHAEGLTHEEIRDELEQRELSDKKGDTSRRLEAAALVRASVTTPGRGRGEHTPITIHNTAPRFARYEVVLTERLRIDVHVAPGGGLDRVAEAASDYFSAALAERLQELDKASRAAADSEKPTLRIGIAGGRTLQAFVDRWPGADFTSESDPTVEIYPFVYKVPEDVPSDASLADLLTRRLRGSRSYEILRDHPLDDSEREAILRIPYVRRYLKAARCVDFALLGIGSFPPDEGDAAFGGDGAVRGAPAWGGEARAVAHVCWRNIARDGRALPLVGPRPVGVALEDLSRMFVRAEVERWRRVRVPSSDLKQVRSLHRLVAVASGLDKLQALKAVLSRNLRHASAPGDATSEHEKLYRRKEVDPDITMAPFLNVLIVDEPLAEALVESVRAWGPSDME